MNKYKYLYGSVIDSGFKEEYKVKNGILYRKVLKTFRMVLDQTSNEAKLLILKHK